jgi:hypothetical protein
MLTREEARDHIESVLLYMPFETQHLMVHQPSRDPAYYAAFDRDGLLVEQFDELDQLVDWLEKEGELVPEILV